MKEMGEDRVRKSEKTKGEETSEKQERISEDGRKHGVMIEV